MKKTGKRQEEHCRTWTEMLCLLLKGGVLGLTAAMVTLLVCAFAAAEGVLSQESLSNAVYAACVLGGIVAGTVAVYKMREFALPLGIGAGGVLFVFLLLTGMILNSDSPAADRVPTVLIACLCGGAIAGILGRKSKKKRKR